MRISGKCNCALQTLPFCKPQGYESLSSMQEKIQIRELWDLFWLLAWREKSGISGKAKPIDIRKIQSPLINRFLSLASGKPFSEKSPAASSTCPACSDLKTSGSVTDWTCYCRLSNEYVTLSPASFTNSAVDMSGPAAKRAFFRSIFSIYIGMEHPITFEGKIIEILSKKSFWYIFSAFWVKRAFKKIKRKRL